MGTRAERDLARALARLNVKELSEFLSALNMGMHEWPTIHSLIEYTHKHGGFDPLRDEPKKVTAQKDPYEGFVYRVPSQDAFVEILCANGCKFKGYAKSFHWRDAGDGADIVAYRVIPEEEA